MVIAHFKNSFTLFGLILSTEVQLFPQCWTWVPNDLLLNDLTPLLLYTMF